MDYYIACRHLRLRMIIMRLVLLREIQTETTLFNAYRRPFP